MREWLRRVFVRAAIALESPRDYDHALDGITDGRVPAGALTATLTTGEIQIRGRYWRVSGVAGQRVAIVAFYPDWNEVAIVQRMMVGAALAALAG